MSKLQYNALRYDINAREVKPFNIFRNCVFSERVEKEVIKYLCKPDAYTYRFYDGREDLYGEPAIRKEIQGAMMHQFWARCEYEMSAGDKFEKDVNNLKAFDVYDQCMMNFDVIFNMIIDYYKESDMLEMSGIKIEERIVQLHSMHDDIMDYGDEELMMYWFEEAVPDGAEEADYVDIASDEDLWSGAVAAYEFICSEMK